jgi:hypothetical protein
MEFVVNIHHWRPLPPLYFLIYSQESHAKRLCGRGTLALHGSEFMYANRRWKDKQQLLFCGQNVYFGLMVLSNEPL